MIDSIAGTRRVVIAGREATEISFDRLSVLVEGGPDKGKSATLRSTGLRIGTDSDNDLVLSDSSVSRRHVALALTSDGVTVQDLDSTNGTWLDGVRVFSAITRLEHGIGFQSGVAAPDSCVGNRVGEGPDAFRHGQELPLSS